MKKLIIILLFAITFTAYSKTDFNTHRKNCIKIMDEIHIQWLKLIKVFGKVKSIKSFVRYKNRLKKIFFTIVKQSVRLRKIVLKIPDREQRKFLNWVLRLRKTYRIAYLKVKENKARLLNNRKYSRIFKKILINVKQYRNEIFKNK